MRVVLSVTGDWADHGELGLLRLLGEVIDTAIPHGGVGVGLVLGLLDDAHSSHLLFEI
jgi:hypothetical protein